MQFFKVIHLGEKVIPELISELNNFQIPFNFELVKEAMSDKPHFNLSLSKNFGIKKFTDWKKYLTPSQDHSIFYPQGIHLMNYLKPKNKNPDLKIEFYDWRENLEFPTKVGDGYSIQYCSQSKEKMGEVNLRVIASSKSFSRTSELLFQASVPFIKDFKLIKPTSMNEGVADYAQRKFLEKYKFRVKI